MELNDIVEFTTSLRMSEKLKEIGTSKIFKEGDVIINDHTYI